jgi:uncharacterized protein with FMN-binding domain
MRRTVVALVTTALAGSGAASALQPQIASAHVMAVETPVAAASRSVTGRAVSTPYGPVKVRITLRGKNITDATAIEYPNDNPHSSQVNAYAVPRLNSEAAAANNAGIAMVSGATYTSRGYKKSLQSVLNKAGL